MAGDERLVVFISSSMEELKPEREVVRSTIEDAGGFEPFAWEVDAAAHGHSAQEEWTRQLSRTDVTIVLLWKKLGEWTKEEIEISRTSGVPILLFRKEDEAGTLQAAEHDYLSQLEDVRTGVTAQYFNSLDRLQQYVDQSLWALIKDRFVAARKADLDETDEVRGARRRAAPSDHGLRVEEAAGPAIRRRDPEDARRLPRNRWAFVGRTAEKRKLMRAIESGDPLVILVGPGGIGKKALLKDLTHNEDFGAAFADGAAIHPSWIDQQDTEDLLQAIWEEFYDTEDPSTVEPRKRRRQLADKEALIFLPDFDSAAHLIEQVLDEMPRTVFCISAGELTGAGLPVEIGGLTDPEEMLALFEGRYRDAIPAEARPDVAALCAAVEGNPSLIEMLAARAWGEAEYDPEAPGEHPLIAWAGERSRMTAGELRDWLVPSDARDVARVARAASVHTPRAVLIEVVGSATGVDGAVADGVLEAASPQYRLSPALGPAVEDGDDLMLELFDSAVRWAGKAGTAEIYANRAFVQRMMDWGARHERWSDVVKLGMATEAAMALGGRHGAWEQILHGVAAAARAMEPEDERASAWALHQLGSRALLRDELKDARILLHESLKRRPEDDADGRKVTRRNLGLVPAAIIPLAVLVLWLVFFGAWAGALVPPVGFEPDLDVVFEGEVPAPANTLRIAATEPFRAGAAREMVFTVSVIDQTVDKMPTDPAFCIVVDGTCIGASSQPAPGMSETPSTDEVNGVDQEGAVPCTLVPVDTTRAEATVTAEQPCFLEIGFLPRAVGTHGARLVLADEADRPRYVGILEAVSGPAAPIADIDPDIGIFETEGETKTFSVINVGTGSFTVGTIGRVPDGFDLEEDTCSNSRLGSDVSCRLTVKFLGGSGAGFLQLDLESAAGTVAGDRAILLVGRS